MAVGVVAAWVVMEAVGVVLSLEEMGRLPVLAAREIRAARVAWAARRTGLHMAFTCRAAMGLPIVAPTAGA